MLDLGYLGVETDFPEQQQLSALPYKKKRNQEDLYKKKKKSITVFIPKKRIVIEPIIICRLKKYRIMSEVFRNKLRKYNGVSNIVVAGLLVNYRIMNHLQ